MSLNDARQKIDFIDTEMAKLFEQRMEAVKEIAEYKRQRGTPIEDKEREASIIEARSSKIEDVKLRPYYIHFLQNTMDVSKSFQRRFISGIRVAYSGVEGAFAAIAARRIFPDGTLVPFPSFEEAYDSANSGSCDLAVLPIENSYAGEVGQVVDLLFSGAMFVNGVYDLSVTHNLLSTQEAHIEDIQKVLSHQQALTQCRNYIQEHGFEAIAIENTALAAKKVSEQGDIHTAAIASRETASLYGLKILDHDINESKTNTTRFAVFSRVEDKTIASREGMAFLLLFTVKDEAGGLAKAVNIISGHGFNMRVLRSRPMKGLPWHYYFYAEVEGDDSSENGRQMLESLKDACPILKVGGHYTASFNALQGGESI